MFLSICEDSNFLSTVLLAKEILTIIKIGVPIILIIMCAIDLGKQVLNTEAKSYQRVLKRAIAAVAVFFIPTIVTAFLDMVGTQNYTTTACWTNANTVTIEAKRAQEKQEEEELIAARKAEQEQANKEREELAEAREEIRKANLEKAEEAEKENSGSNQGGSTVITDGTFLKETGMDGLVKVVEGKFYKPSSGTSGADGTKGTGDYGYVIFFFNRLKAFTDAAAAAGHIVKYSTTEYGAWRPYSVQKYYYDCYVNQNCNNGNLAAYPGKSNHGWGIASDMSYGNYNAKLWAHDHAAEYGLKYNLCNNIRTGDCKEDWHIEPYYLSTY